MFLLSALRSFLAPDGSCEQSCWFLRLKVAHYRSAIKSIAQKTRKNLCFISTLAGTVLHILQSRNELFPRRHALASWRERHRSEIFAGWSRRYGDAPTFLKKDTLLRPTSFSAHPHSHVLLLTDSPQFLRFVLSDIGFI